MFEGTILGSILAFSAALSFRRWPGFIKRFILKHYVLSDMLASIIVYFLFASVSSSITAVFAAIVAGLLLELALLGGRKMLNVT